jgi:hypothetical protein
MGSERRGRGLGGRMRHPGVSGRGHPAPALLGAPAGTHPVLSAAHPIGVLAYYPFDAYLSPPIGRYSPCVLVVCRVMGDAPIAVLATATRLGL